MKLIVDLIYEGGLTFMREVISDTAEYGDYYAGPQVIDEHVRERMQGLLTRIQDGSFAKQWIEENAAGQPNFRAMRAANQDLEVERVGKDLRAMMPWLKQGKGAGQPQQAASVQVGD